MEMNCLISCSKPEDKLLLEALNKIKSFEFKKLPAPNTRELSQLIYSEAGLI